MDRPNLPALPLDDRKLLAKMVDQPIKHLLPEELRLPTWWFYQFWSATPHLTQLTVVAWVRQWMEAHPEVRAEHVLAIYRRLTRADRAVKIEYANELMNAMAGEVARVVTESRERQQLAEMKPGRPATPAELQQVRALTAALAAHPPADGDI